MDLLFYSSIDNSDIKRFQEQIAFAAPESRMEEHRSPEALCARLQSPDPDPNQIVLIVSGREELQKLIDLRELLEDRSIILILPSLEKNLYELAYALHPSFVDSLKSGCSNTLAVLEKMKTAGSGCARDRPGNDGEAPPSR